jgi:predicted nucleic acid-binding protein
LVESAIHRLRFVSDYIRSTHVSFDYPRDPGDQKFIELAIALEATHLISADKDLLSLPRSRTDAGRRFRQRLPRLRVMTAGQFLDELKV